MTVDQSDRDSVLIDVALRPLTVIEFHADRFLDYFRLHLNAGHRCVSPIDVSITHRGSALEYSLLSARRFFIVIIRLVCSLKLNGSGAIKNYNSRLLQIRDTEIHRISTVFS